MCKITWSVRVQRRKISSKCARVRCTYLLSMKTIMLLNNQKNLMCMLFFELVDTPRVAAGFFNKKKLLDILIEHCDEVFVQRSQIR
jgi:hypothetical protein